MKKNVRRILLVFFFCVFAFSAWKIAGILAEYKKSENYFDGVIESYVTVIAPESGSEKKNSVKKWGKKKASVSVIEPDKDNTGLTEPETVPITVDFAGLKESLSENVVGWIYSADTPINYPVLYSGDNDYYLHRLPDGNYNSGGSIFLDQSASPDFSDRVAVIYGHNMKDSSKFGTLMKYKEEEHYYSDHKTVYLLTLTESYRGDVCAGCVIPADSELYLKPCRTDEDAAILIEYIISHATFTTDTEMPADGHYLVMSTCSYEYENARYVLICRLTETE